MYKVNSWDGKRNPHALLQPLKPTGGSGSSGRAETSTLELEVKDDDNGNAEQLQSYSQACVESNRNARQVGVGAYV